MHARHGPSLTHPLFTGANFTPTKFDTNGDKAWFANTLCRFIARDFPESMWTQKLYRRLSLTFGHIAHCDSHGFWAEFFADLRGKVAFLEETLAYPCYGQPDYTYCDAEHAVQSRLHAAKTLATYRALRAAEIEGAERALLTRLREKYEGVPPPRTTDLPTLRLPTPPSPRRNHVAGQASLL